MPNVRGEDWHCANCGKRSGMYGHAKTDGGFYCEKRQSTPAPLPPSETGTASGSASESDPATTELLQALDALYPLPDDAQRAERAGRTAHALKRWMSSKSSELQTLVPKLMERFMSVNAVATPSSLPEKTDESGL